MDAGGGIKIKKLERERDKPVHKGRRETGLDFSKGRLTGRRNGVEEGGAKMVTETMCSTKKN